MSEIHLRAMTPADYGEVGELIYGSINAWYSLHRGMFRFSGGPDVAQVFPEVYHALEPGCGVVAENRRSGRLMGSCFFHPRKHHVSLGIMNVHPNWFGHGVGRALLGWIIDWTEQHGHSSLRLTSSVP